MTDDRSTSVPWARFLSEGVIIVASILLALAAEGWMSARSDRDQERAELEGLRAQLIETKSDLERAIRTDERSIRTAERIIDAAEATSGRGRMAVGDSLVRAFGNTTFFDPPLSRFESIIASGRLGLIRNDELRAAIADWPNVATSAQYAANSRREMFRNQFLAYLLAEYDVSDWVGRGNPPSGAILQLPVDNTFLNLLRVRIWIDGVVLGTERSILRQLDALLALLDEALDTAS